MHYDDHLTTDEVAEVLGITKDKLAGMRRPRVHKKYIWDRAARQTVVVELFEHHGPRWIKVSGRILYPTDGLNAFLNDPAQHQTATREQQRDRFRALMDRKECTGSVRLDQL